MTQRLTLYLMNADGDSVPIGNPLNPAHVTEGLVVRESEQNMRAKFTGGRP